jgi:hypothetical protein
MDNNKLIELISKIDHCKFLISRFDLQISSVNTKVAFYLSINTFILGGICVGYSACKSCPHTHIYWVLFGATLALLIACLGSIFFTIRAVAPYLRDNTVRDDTNSLIFFGGIAKHACRHFEEKFNRQTEEDILIDLTRQAHSIATGLDRKFRHLNSASLLLTTEYFLLVVVIFLTFLNLN